MYIYFVVNAANIALSYYEFLLIFFHVCVVFFSSSSVRAIVASKLRPSATLLLQSEHEWHTRVRRTCRQESTSSCRQYVTHPSTYMPPVFNTQYPPSICLLQIVTVNIIYSSV